MTADDVRIEVAAHLAQAALLRELAFGLEYPSAEVANAITLRWRTLLASGACPGEIGAAVASALGDLAAAKPGALEAAHVRLFGPAAAAPLTETSYGDAGRLLGKSAALADLGGFYRAFGLQPGTRAARPEDHLALELEFASVLALKEAWALAEDNDERLAITRDAAGKFFTDHLGTWLDAWLASLRASDPPAFYVALAEVIREIVRAECTRLGAEPGALTQRAVDREVGGDALVCPHDHASLR